MTKYFIYDIEPANFERVNIVLPSYPNKKILATYKKFQKSFQLQSNGILVEFNMIVYWEKLV